MDDRSALLRSEGWALESARERHEASPDSFSIPEQSALDEIRRGSKVKLLFWFLDAGDDGFQPQCERMWVLVDEREGPRIAGLLASSPRSSEAPLELGARVAFREEHVADVLAPEPDWEEERDFLAAFAENEEAVH